MRLALVALAFATLLLQGYHPFAEDGGLYVAGIEYTLDPTLFPHDTAFVTEHLRFSLFAPTLAALAQHTHLPLPWVLLLVDLLSLCLTFYAAHKLLQRCTSSRPAQLAGLCLLSVFWVLPIAGTSLMLMDPYVTGRSLSTPLTLLAIAFALDPWPSVFRHKARVPHSSRALKRDEWETTNPIASLIICTISLLIAALFHPLMAAYALAFVLILRLTRLRRRALAYALLLLAALALAATLQSITPRSSPALLAAELSRYYWFLSQWQWFELLGLAGPLLILTLLLLHRYRNRHSPLDNTAATLCRAAIAAGLIATTIALLFAHESSRAHLVARLQPLRIFLPIYAVMTLLLGATLTQLTLEAHQRATSRTRRFALISLPATTLLALAVVMFYVQRQTFPASEHLELPSLAANNPNSNANPPRNPWTRAFLWARDNTPRDALFALDAKYVNEDGEDAQTFRAIALRSALPDFSKDGGEAAITPALADLWQPAAAAQSHLYTLSDATRDARILPFGATWIVLHSNVPTHHPCPYDNGTVKVCRLLP
jgi:hypothetical protein